MATPGLFDSEQAHLQLDVERALNGSFLRLFAPLTLLQPKARLVQFQRAIGAIAEWSPARIAEEIAAVREAAPALAASFCAAVLIIRVSTVAPGAAANASDAAEHFGRFYHRLLARVAEEPAARAMTLFLDAHYAERQRVLSGALREALTWTAEQVQAASRRALDARTAELAATDVTLASSGAPARSVMQGTRLGSARSLVSIPQSRAGYAATLPPRVQSHRKPSCESYDARTGASGASRTVAPPSTPALTVAPAADQAPTAAPAAAHTAVPAPTAPAALDAASACTTMRELEPWRVFPPLPGVWSGEEARGGAQTCAPMVLGVTPHGTDTATQLFELRQCASEDIAAPARALAKSQVVTLGGN